jgi:hypothetical protein
MATLSTSLPCRSELNAAPPFLRMDLYIAVERALARPSAHAIWKLNVFCGLGFDPDGVLAAIRLLS